MSDYKVIDNDDGTLVVKWRDPEGHRSAAILDPASSVRARLLDLLRTIADGDR